MMRSWLSDVTPGVPATAVRSLYTAQQLGVLWPCVLGQRLLRTLTGTAVQPEPEAAAEVQRRHRALLARDLQNVQQGLYPAALLFQLPWAQYARCLPAIARDVPRAYRRRKNDNYRDLPEAVDLSRYPAYFRRNFHWQTDGYLSRRSADIYDASVEFLFLGTADVMRRQVIPPVSREVRRRGPDLKLLDVACGTGRMLHQLARAHPRLRYYGLDLSPYYIQHARDLLGEVEHLSLVADNAEQMPFADECFDVVTSVHLLHELPRRARRNVYREISRVLRPGGLVVLEDSAQLSESGELAFFLSKFSREFHEPYHAGYIRDDIATGLAEVGLLPESTEAHFVSKVVVARKPHA